MIRDFIKNLAHRPGIYKMLDVNNRIIYVGKAANLKKRVSSYFNKEGGSIKTQKLANRIKNIEVIITKNEQEALILENSLIKEHKPKYNILLRDDKSFPYIFVDTEHTFPLIKFYRGDKKPLGKYFGPYTQANNLRKTLSLIQKIFKVRQCENSYFKSRKKPCLQYQINRCTAPCVKFVSEKDYKESIDNSVLFLQGKNETLINAYMKKMNKLSDQRKYEEASQIRDKIAIIRNITQSQNNIFETGNKDFITISMINDRACIDVFMIRDGINLGNRPFDFYCDQLVNEIMLLNSFVKQYYLKNIPPEKILVSIKLPDCLLLEEVLSKKYHKKAKIIVSSRNISATYLKICQENTDNRMKQLYLSFSKTNIFDSLSKDLKTNKNIKDIICFDVSHISGANMVGSSIWYDCKGANKKLYRYYNLEKISKSNDYRAINFIVKKRFQNLIKEKKLPNIILVDGGKGQISEAKQVMKDLSITDITILGIVKGHKRHSKYDRVLDKNNNDITVHLKKNSLKILQNIRNEAHRFAIMAQRKKGLKEQYKSRLDKIPGIGQKRKHQILRYFGGIQAVLKSSMDELQNVPGINKYLAETIYYYLQK